MAVLRIRQRRGHQCLTVTTVNQSSTWACESATLHGSTTEPNPSIKAESNTSTRERKRSLCVVVAEDGGAPWRASAGACARSPTGSSILIVLLCCKMCMRSCPGREAEAQIPRMEKMRLLKMRGSYQPTPQSCSSAP